MKYLAATVQFEPEMFAKERNIDALTRLVEEAAASGARLIITPEMGLTGYCWYDREEVAPYVERGPQPKASPLWRRSLTAISLSGCQKLMLAMGFTTTQLF